MNDSSTMRVPELSARVSHPLERWLQWLFVVHPYFLAMLGLSLYLLFGVPQLAHVWMPSGDALASTQYTTKFVWLLLGFVVLLIWFNLPALFVVVAWHDRCPPTTNDGNGDVETRPAGQGAARAWEIVKTILCAPAEGASRWLPFLGEQVGRSSRRAGGVLLLVAGLVLIAATAQIGDFPRICAFGCLFIGVWLLARDTLAARGEKDLRLWVAQGRVLGWLALGFGVGEVVWQMARAEVWVVSYRNYSIWAMFHMLTALVVLGALIDAWRTLLGSLWPRVAAVLFFAYALWHLEHALPVDQGLGGPARAEARDSRGIEHPLEVLATLERHPWLARLEQRLDELENHHGPAVIVIASGGGSRAAIFASLIYEHLARTPMVARRLDRPADLPARPDSTWADHILLISSVSGGSLASAHFTHRGGKPSPSQADLHASDWQDLRQRTVAYVERYAALPGNADLRQVSDWLKYGDPRVHQLLARGPDEMALDFMAPLLRGAMTPLRPRGDLLTDFWQHRYGWTGSTQGAGYAAAGHVPGWDHRPLWLCNTTDIAHGTRLILGFPPLPPGLLRQAFRPLPWDADLRKFDNLPLRRLPKALEDEVDGPVIGRLSLARAVLLSANFPFGFPVARFAVRTPEGESHIEVLDGGLVDNTGVDSVYYLFRALQRVAQLQRLALAAAAAAPLAAYLTDLIALMSALRQAQVAARAQAVLQRLQRRGVVIIEIDSGAKPDPAPGGTLLRGWSDPLRAINNATYTNAALNMHLFREGLTRMLGDLPSGGKTSPAVSASDNGLPRLSLKEQPASVSWVTYTCNHIDEPDSAVMTAWSLGPQDKAKVFGRFLIELARHELDVSLPDEFEEYYVMQKKFREAAAAEGLVWGQPQQLLLQDAENAAKQVRVLRRDREQKAANMKLRIESSASPPSKR